MNEKGKLDLNYLAKKVIELIGGEQNIISLTHCVTRLRFKLKDESIAETDEIKRLEGIITVMNSGGQYQVVVGDTVRKVFAIIMDNTNIQSTPDGEKDNNGIFQKLIDLISGIFAPTLGALAGAGMIKGFLAMAIAFGWTTAESGNYIIFEALGDAMFKFLPVVLGYSAMKKFGGNPFIGIILGAALVYPTITALATAENTSLLFEGTIFESGVKATILGIPLIIPPFIGYESSVIPIIVITYFAAKLEKYLNKVSPDSISLFSTPLITISVIGLLGFLIIGPISTISANLIGLGAYKLIALSPLVYGFVVGGLWQIFVIFGLHWGLIPLMFVEYGNTGVITILAATFCVSFAQIGAVAAVYFKVKSHKTRAIAIPAFISGIFGVTEAAIYGVTLPRKKPFIMSCIAGAVGGAFLQVTESYSYTIGGLGIFAIPAKISPEGLDWGFYAGLISIPLAFFLAFFLTWFFGFDKKELALENELYALSMSENVVKSNKTEVFESIVYAPISGDAILIEDVADEVFASKSIGEGVAIIPNDDVVYAPIDGTITAIFPSNHAIGIVTDTGLELLIHIGVNTVELKGKYFDSHVKEGDKVRKGDKMVSFDRKEIIDQGYDMTIILVITNSKEYSEFDLPNAGPIKLGDVIAIVR